MVVGKNNYKLKREKASNKFYRYSIKRLSVGVASVAVSAGFCSRVAMQFKLRLLKCLTEKKML